jgi:hypothetical protein
MTFECSSRALAVISGAGIADALAQRMRNKFAFRTRRP